ncbi:hypothetical protein NQZ68_007309 [Dissostichus eleginoides]|nr:hypothetical protein NQZ68_007309 [Dissostichus eleginoides]
MRLISRKHKRTPEAKSADCSNANHLPTVDLQQTKDRPEKKRLPAAVSSLSHTETCHTSEERKLNDSQPTPSCAAKHDPEYRALVTHCTQNAVGSQSVK